MYFSSRGFVVLLYRIDFALEIRARSTVIIQQDVLFSSLMEVLILAPWKS